MRKLLYALVVLVLLQTSIFAQTPLYNPTGVQFDATTTDFQNTTSYTLEFYTADGVTLLFTQSVPKANVQSITGTDGLPHYVIPFTSLTNALPAATSYKMRLRAVGSGTSEPSNLTPEIARFSTCVTASGSIMQMRMTTTIPQFTHGTYASWTLSVDSAAPVHWVSVSFQGSGSPAIQFYRATDMRGPHTYTLGKIPRAGTFIFVVTASDEQGCSTTVALGSATVL